MVRCLVALLCCTSAFFAQAQAKPADNAGGDSASATTNDQGPAGIVPYTRGYNLSLVTSSQHDSSNGWSSVLTPDAAYRLNRHFSFDVSAPIYTYINVVQTTGTAAKPVYTQVVRHFAPGDTAMSAHYETSFPFVDYNLTGTLGLPSGSSSEGLGAGHVTYDFNNHFEKSFGPLTPEIELGLSNSSTLTGQRIRRSYVSAVQMAHFQAGASVDLPRHMSFDADAYEDLPISSTGKVLSTTRRGRKKATTATSASQAEDNGIETTLDIPLEPHVTLSGFYTRSLRSRIDTAGFSFTFLLKPPPLAVE